MADEFKYYAEIEVETRAAYAGLEDLNKALGKLGSTAGINDKTLATMNETAHRLGQGLKQAGIGANSANKAIKAIASNQIKALTAQIKELTSAATNLQKGQRDPVKVKEEKDQKAATAKAEADEVKAAEARAKARKVARAKEKADAEKAEAERAKAKEAARARDLAALDKYLEDRANYLRKASKTELEIEQRLDAERSKIVAEAKETGSSLADTLAPDASKLQDMETFSKYLSTISNERYALRDLATSLTAVGIATTGVVTAGVALTATYERAFADVARTSGAVGEAVNKLESDLKRMSATMPVAFGDITSVATLAGQLNIASQDIAAFTETVTMFAATTDVTVDAAAMGLGRLAQLTKTPTAEIGRLASAIYETGINSVATESAILQVSSQIATTGNLAGFAVTEVIALASAMASLGVQPELARGAIMRVFGDITGAVGQAGDRLDYMAKTAGMSADEFADAWSNRPQEAFTALIEGFERTAASGQNLDGVLREMGFANVRDRRVLLLLADNTEVYSDALDDTARAYEENIALSDGYAYITETLSARMQMLLQTIKSLTTTGLGPLTKIISNTVQYLLNLLQGLERFAANNAWVAGIMSGVAGLTALVGGLALTGAAVARVRGAFLGAITAVDGLSRSTAAAGASSGRFSQAVWYARLQLKGFQNDAAAAGAAAATSFKSAEVAARSYNATNALSVGRGLGGIVRMAAPAAAGFAALSLAITGAQLVYSHFNKVSERGKEIFGDTATAMGELRAAVLQDTANVADLENVYGKYNLRVEETESAYVNNTRAVKAALGTQEDMKDGVKETNTELENQIAILGDNTRAWIERELIKDEELGRIMASSGEAFEEIGLNLKDALDVAMDPEGDIEAYFESYVEAAKKAADEAQQALTQADAANILNPNPATAATLMRAQDRADAAKAFEKDVKALQLTLTATDGTLMEFLSNMIGGSAIAESLGVSFEDLEGDIEGAGDKAKDFADTLRDLGSIPLGEMLDAGNFEASLRGLTESVVDAGGSFNYLEEEGYKALQNLQSTVSNAAELAGDDVGAFSDHLLTIYANLEGAGAEMGAEIDWMREIMVNTFNEQWGLELDISHARGSIAAFINDAIQALRTRAELERSTIAMASNGVSPYVGSGKKQSSFSKMLIGDDPVAKQIASQQKAQADAARQNLQVFNGQISSLEKLRGNLSKATSAAKDNAKAYRDNSSAGRGNAKSNRDNANAAKEAAQEIRTLADYANDLSTVWRRAFDLRYGVQNAKDATVSLTRTMEDRFADAAKAIRDAQQQVRNLRSDLQTLAADRNIKEYQLSVAVEYGDDLRAAALRAELAENSEQAAEKTNALQDAQVGVKRAQDDASRSLEGNSNAAIRNRSDVQQLIDSYYNQISALANSGLSTDELQRRTAALRDEFVKQLTQMGFNRAEIGKYTKSFDDLATIIRNVPRNVTVGANTNPAIQALNEFMARARNSSANVKLNAQMPSNIGATGGVYRPQSIHSAGNLSVPKVVERNIGGGGVGRPYALYSTGGKVSYLASGGVAGLHPGRPKGTDTIPAWLSPNENVTNARASKYYGQPFMNAINQMKFPKYLAQGGLAGGGEAAIAAALSGGSIELGPRTIRAIQQSLKVDLEVDNRALAHSVNGTNSRNNNRGR